MILLSALLLCNDWIFYTELCHNVFLTCICSAQKGPRTDSLEFDINSVANHFFANERKIAETGIAFLM